MLILAEKALKQPGVTMKSSFYLKLLSKAARVTTAEHTPVFLVLSPPCSYQEDTMWLLTSSVRMAPASLPLGNKTCISISSSSGRWAERGRGV